MSKEYDTASYQVYSTLTGALVEFRGMTLVSGNCTPGKKEATTTTSALAEESFKIKIITDGYIIAKATGSAGDLYMLVFGKKINTTSALLKAIVAMEGTPLIVVYKKTITPQTQDNIRAKNPSAIFREYLMFQHSWPTHINTPKFRIMSKEEEAAVFSFAYIDKKNLPKVLSTMMMSTWSGAVKGDVLVVEDFSETSGYKYLLVD